MGRLCGIAVALLCATACARPPASRPTSAPAIQWLPKDHYTASIGEPNAGPFRSPCGRWDVRTRSDTDGVVSVILCDVKTRRERLVFDEQRVVGLVWMARRNGSSWLIIDDEACSDFACCRVYNPATKRLWRVDEAAMAAMQKAFPAAYDHEYASADACSPDGTRLLLHLRAYGGGMEAEAYATVDAADGKLIRMFETRDSIPADWYNRPGQ